MTRYKNKILLIGCGSIGQGLLPLLFSYFTIHPEKVSVIAADDSGQHVADSFFVKYYITPVTRENYKAILTQHLCAGDMLINLSVDVSSIAMITWCKSNNVLYLDTCVEPWQGGYFPNETSAIKTSNAWLRQQALSLYEPGAPTAVIAHGMNPGLISHLLKEALIELALSKGIEVDRQPVWADLAESLGVKVVHIVERDTQDDKLPLERGEFTNTWSAKGFYSEAWLQKSEIFLGSHEENFPIGAKAVMYDHALSLASRSANTFLRSWSPSVGEQEGMLVTHHEVVSIGKLLSTDQYRPSVCFVYNPCPKARQSLVNLQLHQPVTHFRVLPCDAVQGFDEIGVLLIHDMGTLWHGCTLSSSEARRLAPYNNATSLQVVAGIIGALVWMLDNPRAGVIEAETMDSEQIMAVARPYLGKIVTIETDWCAGNALTLDKFIVTKNGHELPRANASSSINSDFEKASV